MVDSEFNEWNRKEGARVRWMEKQNDQGWWKEKRLYLEQRSLWNNIANPLKEEYLVNKRLSHGVVVGLKFVPYSDDDVKWMEREDNRLEKQQTKSGVNGRLTPHYLI